MDPHVLIEKALHGKIITCSEGIFLVHFGSWKASEYGIGYAVVYQEDGDKGVIRGRKDVCIKIYHEEITREEAEALAVSLDQPRTFDNYINMEAHPRPRRRQIPLSEPLIMRLTREFQAKGSGWEIVGRGRNCLTAYHSYGNSSDSWCLTAYREGLPSFVFPPLETVDITPEQAKRFSANAQAMVEYFRANTRKPR